MSYAHSLKIGPRPFGQRVHQFALIENNGMPSLVSAGLFAVGLVAILVFGQFWPGDEAGGPSSSVTQVLQSGGDLNDKLGPTAAGYEDPWGDLDRQIAFVARDQDPWGDLDSQIAMVASGGTMGDQAGDYPEYPSAAVIAERALARGGDLNQQMAPTAAGGQAGTSRSVVQDPSYLPSQFIGEIERAESSELPPQF